MNDRGVGSWILEVFFGNLNVRVNKGNGNNFWFLFFYLI